MPSVFNRVEEIATATKQYVEGLGVWNMIVVVGTNGTTYHVPVSDGNYDYRRIMQFVEDGLLVLLEPPEPEPETEPDP